ncbi:hypothetical protein [Limnofasciculus baicalensis]|uniref:Uncharacterized protein n=1 Tax=Limnofasciculus baicalensis BBK-W-15 TaxID=2699891 RepID=A0AAE3GXC0_9CYAN|nr:hypothetical protein [Limnofasciculus baicalensis]MCP2732199.1 hypothetical protein [Limnofasciculus baicalensis BBK-W-15]
MTDKANFSGVKVHISWHRKGLTLEDAQKIKSLLEEYKIPSTIFRHSDPYIPDAIFIGNLVSAEAARLVLLSLPYQIKYIFRPDYPQTEGGDSSGLLIGIGYMSTHSQPDDNSQLKPVEVSQSDLNSLLEPELSTNEFQRRLHRITGCL